MFSGFIEVLAICKPVDPIVPFPARLIIDKIKNYPVQLPKSELRAGPKTLLYPNLAPNLNLNL